MKLREHAQAVEDALLAFWTQSLKADSEEELRSNARVSAYFITELAKRWAERRYYEKTHNKELTIEEAIERSQEATTKFFQRKQRRRAPKEMKETLRDSQDLIAFLEGNEEPSEEPDEQQQPDNQEEPEQNKTEELEEQSHEPVPGSAPYPTVPTK